MVSCGRPIPRPVPIPLPGPPGALAGIQGAPVNPASFVLLKNEYCTVLSLGAWQQEWEQLGPSLHNLAVRMKSSTEFLLLPTEENSWIVNPENSSVGIFYGSLAHPRPSWKVNFESGAIETLDPQTFLQSDLTPKDNHSNGPAASETYKDSSAFLGLRDGNRVQIGNPEFTIEFYTQRILCLVNPANNWWEINIDFVDVRAARNSTTRLTIPLALNQGMGHFANCYFPIRPDGLLIIYMRTAVAMVDINKLRKVIEAEVPISGDR